jgi:3-oxoisoapionate decarboxylase
MPIGLSTYAYFWQASERAVQPLSLLQMMEQTVAQGAGVLQVCDYAPLAGMNDHQLRHVGRSAQALGLALEVGGRGARRASLMALLHRAELVGARLVRSMLSSGEDHPSLSEAQAEIQHVLPSYRQSGVCLGLETYEMVATADLVRMVEAVGDPSFGVVLDASNVVARLEQPRSVVEMCAPYVVNLHVKDFRFERAPGLVGFSLTGCPLGTGLLDLAHLFATVRPQQGPMSQIVEHWLPWQDDLQATLQRERSWTTTALNTLRQLNQ